MEAARELSETSCQLGLAVGHYVKQVATQKIALSLKTDNDQDLKDAERIERMYAASWSSHVSAPAARRQRLSQLNKPVELPLTEDIKTVTDYLDVAIENQLKQEMIDITKLIKLTLASLILFNKRRPAEVAELKFTDVDAASRTEDDNQEIYHSLSHAEKAIAKRCVAALI